jgi:hypothetical protein
MIVVKGDQTRKLQKMRFITKEHERCKKYIFTSLEEITTKRHFWNDWG